MLEISEKPKVSIKVFGEVYHLDRPNMEMLMDLEEKSGAGKNATKLMVEFIAKLGLPEAVAKKLDGDQAQELVKYLSPKKSA
jgi:hypothetical protein